ncbi:MAG: trigger factor [Oscillospiraceae bacterium]|nr:trigger factor [Oscillospiraceae bacterium]
MALTEQKLTENKKVDLVCTVSPEDFEKAVQKAYLRENKKIQLPGFRKGKATRQMIEKRFGENFFYEDAANDLLQDLYDDAIKMCDYELVERAPEVKINKMNKEEGMEVTFTVPLRPELTVKQYKGVSAVKDVPTVSEDEISSELSRYQKNAARVLDIDDRPAALNDEVTIDFDGYVDGKRFEGGKAENHKLILGSHSFIDNFEDQIVGHSIGDEFDVNVTFPEEYGEKSLAGKPAVFKCKLNGIHLEELPELDDELAKDVSEFDTLEELKDDIKNTILKRKEDRANTEFENALMDKIIEGLEGDIHPALVEEAIDNELDQFAYSLQYQGIDMDTYFKYTGLSRDSLRNSVRPTAEKKVKVSLALEAIARAEKLEVTSEDIENEYEKQAKQYQMEVDKLKELLPEKLMKADLLRGKALDFVRDNGVVEEKPEEDKEETSKE